MTSAGATPNEVMSDSESCCSPNADRVLVRRATRLSMPSSIMATKMANAAASKRLFIACTIAWNPANSAAVVNALGGRQMPRWRCSRSFATGLRRNRGGPGTPLQCLHKKTNFQIKYQMVHQNIRASTHRLEHRIHGTLPSLLPFSGALSIDFTNNELIYFLKTPN